MPVSCVVPPPEFPGFVPVVPPESGVILYVAIAQINSNDTTIATIINAFFAKDCLDMFLHLSTCVYVSDYSAP